MFRSKESIFGFIASEQDRFGVSKLCRRYGVSRSGFYAWRNREISQRAQDDKQLIERIEQIFQSSLGTYGSPRIHQALRQQGVFVGRKRVARLMRRQGLKARSARLYRRKVGIKRFFGDIPNRVLDVETTGPDQIWVGDVTYLKIGSQWRYLAVVMDRHSRRILGWQLGSRRNLSLTMGALNRALKAREPSTGLIFHSDRGSEYSSRIYRARLVGAGITQSMKRPRELGDNAFIESYFHSMKSEAIHAVVFEDESELRRVVSSYIRRYNLSRLHSSLDYRSPIDYERRTA